MLMKKERELLKKILAFYGGRCYKQWVTKNGALAQLGARLTGSQEVTGSSPVCSTIQEVY